MLVADREVTAINSLQRWDQAFCVYSKVYSKFNPKRSNELVEYSYLIHSAANLYSWGNVYTYDRFFRVHMEKHPQCNWGIILQQAWAFCLTDKLNQQSQQLQTSGGHFNGQCNNLGENHKGKGKLCFDYNALYYAYGFRCKFDHRCGICGKFGHGASNCRRIKQDSRDNYKSHQGGSDRWSDRKPRENEKGEGGTGGGTRA